MGRLVNFLRGTVRLRVEGAAPEQFLNRCAGKNLPFWQVVRLEDGSLEATIPRTRCRQAMALGAGCGCAVTAGNKRGMPSFLGRFRRRYGFWMGLCCALVSVSLLSHVVFVVDIRGNESVSTAVILQELRQAGLTIGSFGPTLSARDIAHRVLLADDQLCYLAVNLHGIRADVVVRETVPAPEIEDDDTPTDLVASQAGVITRMEVRAGIRQVEVGDTVVSGDLLASGTVIYSMPNDPETSVSAGETAARGKVWARTWHSSTAITPLSWEEKVYTGRTKTRYRLHFLNWTIKFYQNGGIPFDKYDRIKTTRQWTLPGGIALPISLSCTTLREYETAAVSRSAEGTEENLETLLLTRLQGSLGEDDSITDTTFTQSQTDGAVTVTLNSECERQIALQNPIAQTNPITTEGNDP